MRTIHLLTVLLICISGYTQNALIPIPKGQFIPLKLRDDIPESDKKVYEVEAFKMTKFEITNQEFVDFLNAQKPDSVKQRIFYCHSLSSGIQFDIKTQTYSCIPIQRDIPVTNISWYGAVAYCRWKGGRLPTEVEWFYAAGDANLQFPYKFSGSDDAQKVAVFNANRVSQVGTKSPNGLGLYDMTGNVAEWTSTSKENAIAYPYHNFVDKEMKLIACGHWMIPQEIFLNLNSLGCFIEPHECKTYLGFRMVMD